MAGLLFARAGVSVTVIEKHADFFRDFRGDTVHPSTMEILDQLGLLDAFLTRPHNRVDRAQIRIADRDWNIADLSRLATAAPFIALMPQWEFLDFLRDTASAFPTFSLRMEEPVTGSARKGRVAGSASFGLMTGRKLVIAPTALLLVRRRPAPERLARRSSPWFKLPRWTRHRRARGSIRPGRWCSIARRLVAVAVRPRKGQRPRSAPGGWIGFGMRLRLRSPT